ncbi:aminoglycoside phosphotransferase [Frondihabitans sp. PAMC 28766]|nr:aminoglycoside phosphotransferase [Frondihabitans sp. PAMC 28766]
MHDDEVPIDAGLVRRLVDEQLPEWRDEPIREVVHDGTVNAIYRLGSGLAVRLPLQSADPEVSADMLAREVSAMRELAGCCPVATPHPAAQGVPAQGYPLPWSVQTWLPGEVATPDGLASSAVFAQDLVALLTALRSADTKGRRFAGSGRGGDLLDSDGWMDTCFASSEGLLPVDDMRALWAVFRALPPAGPDVMSHSDLTPANLLVEGEHLVGVLDGGGFGPADPALDLIAAWHLLDAEPRAVVRAGLRCGDVEWRRGAAWAFEQCMGIVWYYRESNPGMSALGRSTLRRIAEDPELAALAGLLSPPQ